MPLGNDVVDLARARSHRSTYFDRLLRVHFTDSDLPWVNSIEDGIWVLWSLKEATYKVAVQLGWDGRFDGQIFEVNNLEASKSGFQGLVTFKDHQFTSTTQVTTGYIHSWVGEYSPHNLRERVFLTQSDVYSFHSEFIRQKAIEQLAQDLRKASSDFSIHQDENFVPSFSYEDQPLDLPLSLSHDGHHAAFAFAL